MKLVKAPSRTLRFDYGYISVRFLALQRLNSSMSQESSCSELWAWMKLAAPCIYQDPCKSCFLTSLLLLWLSHLHHLPLLSSIFCRRDVIYVVSRVSMLARTWAEVPGVDLVVNLVYKYLFQYCAMLVAPTIALYLDLALWGNLFIFVLQTVGIWISPQNYHLIECSALIYFWFQWMG
jgi:hypothetical protein